MENLQCLLLFAPLLACQASSLQDAQSLANDGWEIKEENWFEVRLGGKLSGCMWTETSQLAGTAGVLRSSEQLKAKIDRGSDRVNLQMTTYVEEDATHKVANAGYIQSMAQDVITQHYSYGENEVTITSTSGGAESDSIHPTVSTSFIGTARVSRLFQDSCSAGEFSAHTIKPELGPDPVLLTRKLVRMEAVRVDGEAGEDAGVWEVRVTGIPMVVEETYTRDCSRMLRMRVDSPFGAMEATATTKAIALGALDHEGPLPELVYSTSVPLTSRIEGVYRKAQLTFLLSLRASHGEVDFPSSGYQRVTRQNSDEFVIRVDIHHPLPAPQDVGHPDYLASSAMVNTDDIAVRALAEQAVRESKCTSTPECALALRRAVRGHFVRSNLATGFGSAAEAARTREGDCSEHAVLLAAVLRAQNIPARTCSGLVYTETVQVGVDGRSERHGAMGWHMWTQALWDGAWRDLDATLPSDFPYHPGHVTASCSPLSDREAHSGQMHLVNMIGNLDITVLPEFE